MVCHPDPGGPDFDPAKLKDQAGPPPPPKVPGDPSARVPDNELDHCWSIPFYLNPNCQVVVVVSGCCFPFE